MFTLPVSLLSGLSPVAGLARSVVSLAIRRPIATLVAVLIMALTASVVSERRANARLRDDKATLALAHTNDLARRDSTRDVSTMNHALVQALGAIGDSLRVFQRQVVQTAQRNDAIDQALQLERRGRYQLTTSVDSLHRVIASRSPVSQDSLSVRRAEFDVRQAPYTVAMTVELPAPPDTGRVDLHVALDSIPLGLRLSCARPDANGIRAASIEAIAPPWASVRFGSVEQSPELCASPALTNSTTHATGRALVRWTPIVVGAGRVFNTDGSSRWGAFIGTAWALGG